ncbi:MAG: tetratricopeptide repeat protein [Bauldia sp.]
MARRILAFAAAAVVVLAVQPAAAQPAPPAVPPDCTGPAAEEFIEIDVRTDVAGEIVGGDIAARTFAATLACAEAGVARAQWNVGRMFGTGWGVPRDPAAAEAWYRRSAEQGFAFAEVSVALTLAAGTPTQEQLAEALTFFIRAANQGDSFAMMRTALAYEGGLGTPVDLMRAAAWYTVATGFNEPGAFDPMYALQSTLPRAVWEQSQDLADDWAEAWNANRPLPPI